MTVIVTPSLPERRPAVRCQAVRIEAAGRSWSAAWCIEDGSLVVMSAYGCRRSQLGGADPARKARLLLKDILRAWSTTGRPSLEA